MAHGIRRTNADKRRAVTTLLMDTEWQTWTDAKIAQQCAVSDRFVGLVRNELSLNGSVIERRAERNGQVYVMNTAGIGRSAKAGAAPANGEQQGDHDAGVTAAATPPSNGNRAPLGGPVDIASALVGLPGDYVPEMPDLVPVQLDTAALAQRSWFSVAQGAPSGEGDQMVLITIPGSMAITKKLTALLDRAVQMNCRVLVTEGLPGLVADACQDAGSMAAAFLGPDI